MITELRDLCHPFVPITPHVTAELCYKPPHRVPTYVWKQEKVDGMRIAAALCAMVCSSSVDKIGRRSFSIHDMWYGSLQGINK